MDEVFKALADEGRRALLDALRDRDGQNLGELCEVLPDMTRFGVMKHLRVLEEAHLVVAVRSGRSKLHYLNAVPIREIHDRWISRYSETFATSLLGLAAPATTAVAAPRIKTVVGSAKTDGTRLNLRRAPSAAAERFGSIANGATVWIVCQVSAQRIAGTVRTTTTWNRLANGAYVSDAYIVRPNTTIPACVPAPDPAPAITR